MLCIRTDVNIFLFSITLLISEVATLFGPDDLIYNETEARILYDHAAAAYSYDPDECFKTRFSDGERPKIIGKFEKTCDMLTSKCFGIVSEVAHEKKLVVAWQGTNAMSQFFFETLTLFIPDKYFYDLGEVNFYFGHTFEMIWQFVEDFMKMEKYKDYDVIFTGHSLGGSLAVLSAVKTVHNGLRNSSQVKLITFAEPRTGSLNFAKNVDEMIKYKFRVIHGADLLAHLPPCHKDMSFLPDRNLPCDTKSKTGPYHHMTEVWYPDGMHHGAKYQICDGTQGEEHFCSDKVFIAFENVSKGITDHRKYFGKMTSQYGKAGCDMNREYDESEGFLGFVKTMMDVLNMIF